MPSAALTPPPVSAHAMLLAMGESAVEQQLSGGLTLGCRGKKSYHLWTIYHVPDIALGALGQGREAVVCPKVSATKWCSWEIWPWCLHWSNRGGSLPVCLGRAPDKGLEGLSPLASRVTLAHSNCTSLPVVDVSVPSLPSSWCTVCLKVLRAWEMMPPRS